MHPEIDEQEIVAPLIGLGLPRTGSTALSCLLAADPAVRTIRNWEAQQPCPPPESATQETDARIQKSALMLERRNRLFPRMKMMVPSTTTSPTECQTFMAYDFKSQLFQAMFQIPSYVEWLNHKADLVPTYRYVKRVLKLLQWHCPPHRWRLKNPSHCLFIDALVKVFPDARFWMTHRDVASVIPSVADLYYELTKAFSDAVDTMWLGRMTSDFCELGMRRMMAFRDAGHDYRLSTFISRRFRRTPSRTLRSSTTSWAKKLTPQARLRMEAWRRETPRDKHGGHGVDPSDFGLYRAQLRERFAFYSQRFNGVSAV